MDAQRVVAPVPSPRTRHGLAAPPVDDDALGALLAAGRIPLEARRPASADPAGKRAPDTLAIVTAGRFDVLAYSAAAQGRFSGQLHRAEYGERVPGPELAAAIGGLGRVVDSTARWLGRTLVTATHKDARMTAFLASWALERHWCGEALQVIAGIDGRLASQPTRLERMGDRFGPLGEALLSNVHGSAVTAVHAAERFVDARLLDVLLTRAAALGGDAALGRDLERVRAVLAAQTPFFAETAEAGLAESARARRLARRRLRRRSWPLGADARTIAALRPLTLDPAGWTASLDAEFDALPGLAGLHLAQRAAKPGRGTLRTTFRSRPVSGCARSSRKDPGD